MSKLITRPSSSINRTNSMVVMTGGHHGVDPANSDPARPDRAEQSLISVLSRAIQVPTTLPT